VQRHLIVPVALGSMALAGAGWFVGIATGSSPDAAGTSVTTRTFTVTEKGTVVSVHGAPEVSIVKKKIPPRTITSNGKVITLPASTVDEVRTQTRTRVVSHTTPGRTVTKTTPPVTLTNTVTQTQTQTQTITLPGTTVTITITT
jgi:hypothetical protein